MSKMNSGEFYLNQMKVFHLEFYHAFSQVFTDAVIEALSSAKRLEGRLGAREKMAARFLLQINLLDELGFHPGTCFGLFQRKSDLFFGITGLFHDGLASLFGERKTGYFSLDWYCLKGGDHFFLHTSI
ncbi:hypothetical protein [Serratia plymuthica]|uniref:hypothetical protein n=1 Tax=Serratia plymuthica TaxID=82996 RepID=UPI0020163D10|nr:hypothetical protein [Serratia plymuthica]